MNFANYDYAKANPFPNLPDPLTLKSGAKGAFLAGVGAGPANRLLGKKDLRKADFSSIEPGLMAREIAIRQHGGGPSDRRIGRHFWILPKGISARRQPDKARGLSIKLMACRELRER